MSKETYFDFAAACDQVFGSEVIVKLKRLEQHEIDAFTPSWKRRRRNVRRKHEKLDFDKVDDDVYFSMVCEESTFQERRSRRRIYKKSSPVASRRSSSVEENFDGSLDGTQPTKLDIPSLTISSSHEPLVTPHELSENIEDKIISVPENTETVSERHLVREEPICAVSLDSPAEPPHPRIRVKTATELGMVLAFIEEGGKMQSKRLNLLENAFSSSGSACNSVKDSDISRKLDLKIIAKLYQKYFTVEIQERIKCVAKTLKNIEKCIDETDASIDRINRSKSSDSEKLMMRFQTYGESKRKKNILYTTVKNQFKFLDKVDENFELLFQLLFLSILKILFQQISSPHKKGTLFKKILKLLSNCFESQPGKHDRLFNVLKKTSFHSDCLALFRFLEKNRENKFFEFLLVSDKDEEKSNETNTNLNIMSSGHFVLKDRVDMRRCLPCGSHLIISNSRCKPALKANQKTEISVNPQIEKRLMPVSTFSSTPLGMKSNSSLLSTLNSVTASVSSNQPATAIFSNSSTRMNNSSANLAMNNGQKVIKYTVKMNGQTVTLHPTDSANFPVPVQNPSPLVNVPERSHPTGCRNSPSYQENTTSIPFSPGPTILTNHPTIRTSNYTPYSSAAANVRTHEVSGLSSMRVNETSQPVIENRSPVIRHTANETISYQDSQLRPISITYPNGNPNYVPFTPITTNTNNHVQQAKPNTMSVTSRGKNNENRVPAQLPSDDGPPSLKNLVSKGSLSSYSTDFHNGPVHQHGIMDTTVAAIPSVSRTNLNSNSKHLCSYKFCENDATVICGGCSKTFYCGNHCQKLDWVCGHDRICSLLV